MADKYGNLWNIHSIHEVKDKFGLVCYLTRKLELDYQQSECLESLVETMLEKKRGSDKYWEVADVIEECWEIFHKDFK